MPTPQDGHTQTIHRLLPTNCLSVFFFVFFFVFFSIIKRECLTVFDHFVGLALKRLSDTKGFIFTGSQNFVLGPLFPLRGCRMQILSSDYKLTSRHRT